MIVFKTFFDISATWTTQNQVKTKIRKDLQIKCLLLHNGTVQLRLVADFVYVQKTILRHEVCELAEICNKSVYASRYRYLSVYRLLQLTMFS